MYPASTVLFVVRSSLTYSSTISVVSTGTYAVMPASGFGTIVNVIEVSPRTWVESWIIHGKAVGGGGGGGD